MCVFYIFLHFTPIVKNKMLDENKIYKVLPKKQLFLHHTVILVLLVLLKCQGHS